MADASPAPRAQARDARHGRRILIITAESTRNVNLADPHFQAVLVELGLLALIVLALAGGMRLLGGQAAEER